VHDVELGDSAESKFDYIRFDSLLLRRSELRPFMNCVSNMIVTSCDVNIGSINKVEMFGLQTAKCKRVDW